MMQFLILCLGMVHLAAFELPFCIVIPSYNNEEWVEANLDSVFDQKYENYRVIYIADAPTDRTIEQVKRIVLEKSQEHRFTLLINRERQGPLACMCQAVFSCAKHEIVIDLDGNDWLSHNAVLSYLNKIYSDSDVWATYGQFCRYPSYAKGFASQVPEEILETNTIRSYKGGVTHLKTFYASLFQEIKKTDFFYEGKFIRRAGDLAYMLPILEMAGKHTRFIPDILYIYNYNHPIHPHKVSDGLEEQMDHYIRDLPPYSPLTSLPSQKFHPIYFQIENLYRPTLKEYRLVQDYLTLGARAKLDRLADMEPRMRQMKIVGDTAAEFPRSGNIAVNSDPDERENCILLYSTFNERYPQGLERLVFLIQNSDFKGHLLYRLGGWPNVEGGSLVLSHVPYAFKIAFFQEAQRLGYKRALWLDVAVVPLVSLNEIFRMIEEKGIFAMGCNLNVGPYINAESAAFFGLNLSTTYQIPSCSAGLFGVDFSQRLGQKVLNWWQRAAFDSDAFFSPRSDQNALSLILFQLGFKDLISMTKLPHTLDEIKSDSLFWLNREFVH